MDDGVLHRDDEDSRKARIRAARDDEDSGSEGFCCVDCSGRWPSSVRSSALSMRVPLYDAIAKI
jgi:hypothetical protein